MPSLLGVRLFREPDAGNPPVRFDEREQEPEPSQTGLRQRRESAVNSHRETKATAPVLDSTRDYTYRPNVRMAIESRPNLSVVDFHEKAGWSRANSVSLIPS